MANLTATLYITIKTKAGKWTTVKPAMWDNGRLKKLVAVLDGKEEKHPEGQYKVRWLENGKPRFDSVGNDPDSALMAFNRREKALAAIAAGVEVKNTDGKQRHRIAEATAQYLSFVKESTSGGRLSHAASIGQESTPRRPGNHTTLSQICKSGDEGSRRQTGSGIWSETW